jgi:sporulation protein YlmC with PRC-barrel domain
MRVRFDRLEGRTVIDSGGRAVGELETLYIDTESWQVDGLRVKLRREIADLLGLRHSTFRSAAVDLPATLLQGAGDTVLLKVPVEELRSFAGSTVEAGPPVH